MDKFKAWLQDKKNLPIVVGVTAVVLIGVVFVYLRMFGIIGGGGSGEPAPETATAPTEQSAPGMPAGTPGMESVPGGAPAPSPGAPAPAPGAPAPSSPGAAQAEVAPEQVQPPMLPYRKDPFMPFTGPPTKTQVLMNLVPQISRIRIAPASVTIRPVAAVRETPATEQVLPPQPFRRVAGILWDGGSVKAILETEGQVEIVKPGDVSQYSRVRVERIEPDSVILKTLDTPTPMTVKVNLAGSLAAQQAASQISPAPTSPAGRTGEGPPPGQFWEGPPPGGR